MSPPQMRNFLVSRFKRDMVVTVVACTAVAVAHRLFYVNPRIQAYADYHKNLDPDKDFEAMKKAGVLHSAPPDE